MGVWSGEVCEFNRYLGVRLGAGVLLWGLGVRGVWVALYGGIVDFVKYKLIG